MALELVAEQAGFLKEKSQTPMPEDLKQCWEKQERVLLAIAEGKEWADIDKGHQRLQPGGGGRADRGSSP